MAATPYAKSEDTNLIDNGTTIAGALGRCSGKRRLSLIFFHPDGPSASLSTALVATEKREDGIGEGPTRGSAKVVEADRGDWRSENGMPTMSSQL